MSALRATVGHDIERRQIDVWTLDGKSWTAWDFNVEEFEAKLREHHALNVGIPGATPSGWRIATAHVVAWRLADKGTS